MAEQEDKVEPVGPQILDFYLSYLHGQPKHLPIEAKKALRLCCKKFKYFFDASIDDANVYYRDDNEFHAICKGKFIRFRVLDIETVADIPTSFKSLDLTCRMLPSLKMLNVTMSTLNALDDDGLPESLGQLTSLTQLRLFHDKYVPLSLPASFSQLTLLESLSLSQFFYFNDLLRLTGFKALVDLSFGVISHQMIDLADFLLNFPKLKSVNIRVVGLGACSLSGNFGSLQLTRLALHVHGIPSLPESLGDMSSLISLDLSAREGLKTLPASLGNLTALEKLSLSSIELATLPDSIAQLKHLNCFDLYKCMNLSKLPCSIGDLESLVELRLTNCNALTELPESVGNLKCLKNLQLRECESLVKLPDSLTRLKLSFLMISACDQLVEPPVQTLLQKHGTALTYYSAKKGLTISSGQVMQGVVEEEED
jgi:Leucine-rich repeat (LRR) protein